MTGTEVDEIPWPEITYWPVTQEATTSSNNGETQVPRPADLRIPVPEAATQPAGPPLSFTDVAAVKTLGRHAGRVQGWFRAVRPGPAAWPLFSRRCPSVLEVLAQGRDFTTRTGHKPWDNPSVPVRWAFRAFWIADACWETLCMTARVWFRTRITWAVTILLVASYLIWGH